MSEGTRSRLIFAPQLFNFGFLVKPILIHGLAPIATTDHFDEPLMPRRIERLFGQHRKNLGVQRGPQ